MYIFYISMYIFIYKYFLYTNIIFFLNYTCMCVYLDIHNTYTQYTHIKQTLILDVINRLTTLIITLINNITKKAE